MENSDYIINYMDNSLHPCEDEHFEKKSGVPESLFLLWILDLST